MFNPKQTPFPHWLCRYKQPEVSDSILRIDVSIVSIFRKSSKTIVMKIFNVLLLILISSVIQINATSISGIVFTDANGNGIRDKNENGMKGVAVSDQVHVFLTDANGFYQIPSAKGYGIIFISMPPGFKAIRSFYAKVDLERGNSQVDFPLTKVMVPTHFKFIHASDIHIEEKSLHRMHKFQDLGHAPRE